MSLDLLRLTAVEASRLMRDGELSPRELTSAFLNQIERHDGEIAAYLQVRSKEALAEAGAMTITAESPPLAGIPTAIKDVLCVEGAPTTCSSRFLKDYVPIYTATCVRQLLAAGVVSLGKTNMDEFAMGSSTENSAFGPTRNPWDTGRVPGGSSGGSAAAVAAGEAVWAVGSDTGGSIRQPAAFCGVVGLKPTYGSVSRYGLVAFASSLDQVGPITRSVADAALAMRALIGKDPLDSTSVEHPSGIAMPTGDSLAGVRIGVVKELLNEGVDPGVRESFETTIASLEAAGATIGEASLPHSEYALAAYYILAPAEASANLARYDGVRFGHRAEGAPDINAMYEQTRSEGFGDEVKRRVMLGTYALSSGYYDAYYGQAQKVRTLIVQDFARAFEEFDLLASPTTPTTAFRLGEKTSDPLTMYMSDSCTIPVNLTGLPAISIPCGLVEGLPVGFQLIGPAFSESALLQAAHGAEAAIGFDAVPEMIGGEG
ncbi:MAG: Asp-tRNA(Asn)/Glu-tRNA(Gln) amidotransferase subunit GatA [Thermoleophilia bacterium]